MERKAGYYIEFKLESLLRGDIASRATYYAQGRQWGWLSVNDIRRLENMPAIGSAGDIYLQPLNCINAEITDDYFKKQEETKNKMTNDILNMIKQK
jgi:hypothetical protein